MDRTGGPAGQGHTPKRLSSPLRDERFGAEKADFEHYGASILAGGGRTTLDHAVGRWLGCLVVVRTGRGRRGVAGSIGVSVASKGS